MIIFCNFFKNWWYININCLDEIYVYRVYVIGKNKLKKNNFFKYCNVCKLNFEFKKFKNFVCYKDWCISIDLIRFFGCVSFFWFV